VLIAYRSVRAMGIAERLRRVRRRGDAAPLLGPPGYM
jgi:hypothetical protein